MPPSKAKKAEVADRRIQLIRLRRAGISFDDPRILSLGYASRQAASKDMIRALQERRDEQDAEVSVYRQEENERLDALLEAAWPRATQPQPVLDKDGEIVAQEIDLRAVETVLKLMDRRAKLNGYDMPAKSEVSGSGGGPLSFTDATAAELHRLIGIAGDGAGSDAGGGEQDDDGNGDD